MNATDLISFVPLHDDRGRTVARYYPQTHMLTIKAGDTTLTFPLSGAATKAQECTPIKAHVNMCKSIAKR